MSSSVEVSSWMDDGDVLLHVGMPKSGTTAIQSALQAQRDALDACGVLYPGNGLNHWLACQDLVRSIEGDPRAEAPAPARRVRRLERSVAQAAGRRTVVSAENLVRNGGETARRLVERLGGSRVRVVITLRSLEQMLPSDWQQTVKNGTLVSPYEIWLRYLCTQTDDAPAQQFWARNDHAAAVRRWVDVVGVERVAVVVLDPSDHSMLFRSFEALIGVPNGTLVAGSATQSNRGLSAEEAELLRVLTELAGREPGDADVLALLPHGGIRTLVEGRRPGSTEHRLGMPEWATDVVRRQGSDAVRGIESLGVTVLGDLSNLVPTSAPAATSIDTPTSIPIDAAALLLQGVIDKSLQMLAEARVPPSDTRA